MNKMPQPFRSLRHLLTLLPLLAACVVLFTASGCKKHDTEAVKLIEPDYSYVEAGLMPPRTPIASDHVRASAKR